LIAIASIFVSIFQFTLEYPSFGILTASPFFTFWSIPSETSFERSFENWVAVQKYILIRRMLSSGRKTQSVDIIFFMSPSWRKVSIYAWSIAFLASLLIFQVTIVSTFPSCMSLRSFLKPGLIPVLVPVIDSSKVSMSSYFSHLNRSTHASLCLSIESICLSSESVDFRI